ncbi:MAG: hypothetical protein ACOWWO_13065 [Peptococcaceae bacterium]
MMVNKYFCVNCLQWVDKLYSNISLENGEKSEILMCQSCFLEENEVRVDSDLLHYSISKDILEEYLQELKDYNDLGLLEKDYIEKEVDYLEEVVLPSIYKRISELKENLI